MDEESIIKRVILQDDRQAFGYLVKLHQSSVRQLLMKLSGQPETADEMAQETFLRAYKSLVTFKFGSKFSSWLYRIAFNVYLNETRRGKLLIAEGVRDSNEELNARNPVLCYDLEQAMKFLSDNERRALQLCLIEQQTQEEAASQLALPLGTLKSYVKRGKERLKKALKAWHPGEVQ